MVLNTFHPFTLCPPRVSVVLPVYNVASYIQATIKSILTQTFADFELLILDDHSTDDTVEKVASMKDARIRLIRNPRNQGRAATDNDALTYVRGEFIAKMDGDDLCHPERLARQVAALDQNPDINVVGSWMHNFGASNYLNCYPVTAVAAQVRTLFTLPTGNPSVMLRSQLFREGGMRYNAELRQTEDYDFFARYIRELRIHTLPLALISYRVPSDTKKTAILAERAAVADTVRTQLLHDWGIPCSNRECHIHNTIAMLERSLGDISLQEVEAWLHKILMFNQQEPLFDTAALQQGLGEWWFEICYTHPQPRLTGMKQFRKSPFSAYFKLNAVKRLRFWVRAARYF